jgi:hypothetical protein
MNFNLYTLVIKNIKLGFGLTTGWGNGYVLLPKSHPFYNMDYDDIPVRVHGGLTFGELFNPEYIISWINNRDYYCDISIEELQELKDYYIIGFDTCHYGDNMDNCSLDFVIEEANYLLEQCLDDSDDDIRKYKTNIS